MDEIRKQFENELQARYAQMFELEQRIKELKMGIATLDAVQRSQPQPSAPQGQ
ncbi:MAG: hypothetical protein ACPHN2_04870 [Sinimarinibacterium flocculans]|uniref:hypothetical protein n=1 Tax=Sinimarinibacterium flocculans TaxID=985250 RepID=UPI003C5F1E8E